MCVQRREIFMILLYVCILHIPPKQTWCAGWLYKPLMPGGAEQKYYHQQSGVWSILSTALRRATLSNHFLSIVVVSIQSMLCCREQEAGYDTKYTP